MQSSEIARVQAYLRATFGNERLTIAVPQKKGGPIEVSINGEFIAVLHRDEDEGEVSYALHMTILEEDLPNLATR